MDANEINAVNAVIREMAGMLENRFPGFAEELAKRITDDARHPERIDDDEYAHELDNAALGLRMLADE
jgi:hypothetical protein